MKYLYLILSLLFTAPAMAALKVGADAPLFNLKNQKGEEVKLTDRQGKWTVLYFYPKAATPGCTKQACAFRDSIKVIREKGAEVYGISGDEVPALKSFHDEHKLNFDLLADPEATAISAYDVKMPMLKMSKRITFIVGPDLKVAHVELDVDPMLDANKVAQKLVELVAGK